MNQSYLKQYRTFDELVEAVRVDLPVQANEGQIEPAQLIKIVQLVNHDLGLRIQQDAEAILEVDSNKARLPLDFHILNRAFLLGSYKITTPVIHGRHTEERIIEPGEGTIVSNTAPTGCCSNAKKVQITPCGDYYQVVETFKTETRTYEEFTPLELSPSKYIGKNCPNVGQKENNKATIRDGFIFTNFQTGKIYMSYLGSMIDDEGNLLVIDHPQLNEYYEYALKERILENLMMMNEPVDKQLQYVLSKKREARNNALSYVNTPDFAEMKALWSMNRKAMYHKYYNPFA